MPRRSRLALVFLVAGCASAQPPGAGAPTSASSTQASPPAERSEEQLAQRIAEKGLSFNETEALAVAWGLVPRASSARRIGAAGLHFDDDLSREIAASIYSLPSTFFSAEEARRFLSAVHAGAPAREILVLADPPMRRALSNLDGVRTLPTFGRAYSPWPRDPMSLARRADGGLAVLLRPNLQRGREEDATLGRALVQTLPDDLDRRWRQPGWAVAGVPFHNGQVLLAPDAAWITIHTLEPRSLEILGTDRVPVESFGTAAGIDRYLAAARRAGDELAALYGRPVRFVHPLPESGPESEDLAARVELLRDLGGGAGIDLDSIVTLLPRPAGTGPPRALVADLAAGAALLGRLAPGDLAGLRAGYGFAAGIDLPGALRAALDAAAARGLGRFLDRTAAHLGAQGLEVRRLPLLIAPIAALRDRRGLAPDGTFLIGWNNAVIDTRGEGRTTLLRAEAFASLLPLADREAVAVYAALSVDLALLPSLPESVIRGGGYRCASNHVRSP